MEFGELPKLEETMPSLAAYLMIAAEKHPRLVLSEPEDMRTETRSLPRLRITQHYTAALLAYGFPVASQEIQTSARWFASPFGDDDEIDQLEMTRLEGLINIAPEDPLVEIRLRQLIRQRNAYTFEIVRDDLQGALVFDTLWALKLLILARQKGLITDSLITTDALQESINEIMRICQKDKDLALALRLQYELTGKLEAPHVAYLDELVKRAQDYQNILAIRPQDWVRIKDLVMVMQKRQLRPGMIEEYGRYFRDFVLNMCYVIENLVVLKRDYPQVCTPIETSMMLWWEQFRGENAISVLNAFLPDEYHFLMVLCRTLVTVSEYIGEPPGAKFWLSTLRETSRKFDAEQWPELHNIKQALRQWIGVEIHEYERLKLGLSSANVVRIKPLVYNPTDERHNDILNTTLVVKYGPVDEIDVERANYRSIPERIRGHFVNIPKETSITDDGRAFVIMQDLEHFRTLFEDIHYLLKPDPPQLPEQLADFLLDIHKGENGTIIPANKNHLREIYTLPTFQHIDYIMLKMQQHDMAEHYEQMRDLEDELNDLIAGVIKYQYRLEGFPLAFMHGDLHTRNIMIHSVYRSRNEPRLHFRLIDLESIHLHGDAAHDAGQLLIDINLLPTRMSGKKNLARQTIGKIQSMHDALQAAYLDFAKAREDTTFETRLELAKARALIRIAKGRTKRSEEYFKNLDIESFADAVEDILELSGIAITHLRKVYDALK